MNCTEKYSQRIATLSLGLFTHLVAFRTFFIRPNCFTFLCGLHLATNTAGKCDFQLLLNDTCGCMALTAGGVGGCSRVKSGFSHIPHQAAFYSHRLCFAGANPIFERSRNISEL